MRAEPESPVEVRDLIARAGVVVVSLAGRETRGGYELGLADSLNKPTIVLHSPGAASPLPTDALLIPYASSEDGLREIRQRFSRALVDVSRISKSARKFPGRQVAPPQEPKILLENLSQPELRRLCTDVLVQMGYRLMEMTEPHDFDVAAALPRRDPDGFEYQELWLIAIGTGPSSRILLEMATRAPEVLLKRATPAWDRLQRAGTTLRGFAPASCLFIVPDESSIAEEYESEIRRADRRPRDRLGASSIRLRYWGKQQLLQLLREYPQVARKYFPDEVQFSSRSPSLIALRKEIAALRERLDKAVKETETVRAATLGRGDVWQEISLTAAHKLGNPLFALETYFQSIRERVAAGDSISPEVLTGMESSLEKAKAIIQQFKSLTKAQEISPQPTELLPLFDSACELAKKKGVRVEFRVPDELPKISVDQGKFAECLDELVANALHWFDKDDKRITVTVELASAEALPPSLDRRKKYVAIRVADNGKGVPPDSKERIFTPFYSTYVHGTGLGLALVKRTIEEHGGSISEVGTYGEGAAFVIHIPAVSAAEG